MAERKRKLEVDDSPAGKKQELLPEDDPTGGINPYTGKAYSSKYYEILKKRKGVECCISLPPSSWAGDEVPADSSLSYSEGCAYALTAVAATLATAAVAVAPAVVDQHMPWLYAF